MDIKENYTLTGLSYIVHQDKIYLGGAFPCMQSDCYTMQDLTNCNQNYVLPLTWERIDWLESSIDSDYLELLNNIK